MLNICIFAGTTEGRELVEFLSDKNAKVTACVATEYGEEVIPTSQATIHIGRLDYNNMLEFFSENKFDVMIDATHPYAKNVTKNIIAASDKLGIEYLRLNRNTSDKVDGKYFPDIEQAVDYLTKTDGNILLTTGSNDLSKFTRIPSFKERIYPRVLPVDTSLEACRNNGYDLSHIIAMQGPFTMELNKAMIKAFNIKIIVTKESGDKGGFMEKIKAAQECNTEIIIINRPEKEEGKSFEEVIAYLSKKTANGDGVFLLSPQKNTVPICKKVNVIGIGVGDLSQMTLEAHNVIKGSDVIIGAKRILESCAVFNKPIHCAFMPDEVVEYINNNTKYKSFSILMSGDVGFYSGAKKLLEELKDFDVNIVCGISSPVYMCSRLGIPWEDINLSSLHGRDNNIINSVKTNFRTFTLVGGDYGVTELCNLLCEYNLGMVKLYVGERLSYDNEKINVGTADELRKKTFHKLSSVIIENDLYNTRLNLGIADNEFIRYDKVPMTKSEIRAVSISKLKLSNDSIVYDIGAGSGSVSIETALYAHKGTTYAIEKNHEAISLIEENKVKFGVPNIITVEGMAPEVMDKLPIPTHAFIGGSSGNLCDIVESLIAKNSNVKIVINAISLETVAEALDCIKRFNFNNTEIVNMTISKSKKLGKYNMMMGQNPIYIIILN